MNHDMVDEIVKELRDTALEFHDGDDAWVLQINMYNISRDYELEEKLNELKDRVEKVEKVERCVEGLEEWVGMLGRWKRKGCRIEHLGVWGMDLQFDTDLRSSRTLRDRVW